MAMTDRTTRKFVLIFVVVVVLVLLLSVAIRLGWQRSQAWMAEKAEEMVLNEPERVIREHLEALNREDYAHAYGMLSRTAKAELTLTDFTEIIRHNPQVFKTSRFTRVRGLIQSTLVAGSTCTIRGTVTNTKGGEIPVRVVLVSSDGRWLFWGFHWQDGEEWRYWGIQLGGSNLDEGS
jgi:hypothetical protein